MIRSFVFFVAASLTLILTIALVLMPEVLTSAETISLWLIVGEGVGVCSALALCGEPTSAANVRRS